MKDYTAPDALQRVVDEVDRTACEMDRIFFRDHPRRSYWVRPAQPAEIIEFEMQGWDPPPGSHTCIAVRRVTDAARFRVPFSSPFPSPTDLSEDLCRAWYERVSPPQSEEIAQTLTAAPHTETEE